GGKSEEQNSVLLEIFKSNLELVRGMQDPVAATAVAPAEDAPSEAAGAADPLPAAEVPPPSMASAVPHAADSGPIEDGSEPTPP
ncbi:hypothetical protein, partial [Klebsiella pneumoniae]|uniref:hypothetical protein n=1 Tax=Klebsiella pneumoniae TaxID=573 RepID=UPI0030134676